MTESDITENDAELGNSRVKNLIQSAAREFEINPGLLAEHLLAEPDRRGRTLAQFLNLEKISSANLGLDDFVREQTINKLVRGAGSISEKGSAASFDPKKDELHTGSDPKPQSWFAPEQGVRAIAAYIKYKEKIAKGKDNIGDELCQRFRHRQNFSC